MANPGHDFRVVVLLNADEFLAMKHSAEEEGISQSSFIRSLLKKDSRARALQLVCDERREHDSAEAAQLLTKCFGVVA